MRLDWLLNPVTFYSGASVCLLVSLALFVSIKLEVARTRCRMEKSEDSRESEKLELLNLKAEVENLRQTVSQLEEARPAVPAGEGINLTKRAQALRMHRRGESISSIAAALETPTNEIALLLKVNSLTSDVASKAS